MDTDFNWLYFFIFWGAVLFSWWITRGIKPARGTDIWSDDYFRN